MSFHVGQKVVCIEEVVRKPWWGETLPKKGEIYTVRGIETTSAEPGYGVWLAEIVNAPRQYYDAFGECSFHPFYFRPLIERKTDISVFRALLNPNKQLERA